MNTQTKYWSITWDTNSRQKKIPSKDVLLNFLNGISDDCVFQYKIGARRKKEHYTSARLISNYIDKKGKPPKAFLIDAPRDEESKYLHEIYGVLEEINNGRLFASFHGKIIKTRIPRGIPIIIFSNSPPIFHALSHDRWDIKALYRTIDNSDVYVQNAKISCLIQKTTYHSITWNTVIETLPYVLESDSRSDKMLFDMYTQNFIAMKKEKELRNCPKTIPGLVKKMGSGQTSTINKAPEYILFEAQKKFT